MGKAGMGMMAMGGPNSIQTVKQGMKRSGMMPGSQWVNDGTNELFVGNLPPDTSDLDLYEMFSPFGAIPPRGIRAMLNEEGVCKGVGFVNFINGQEAQVAVA